MSEGEITSQRRWTRQNNQKSNGQELYGNEQLKKTVRRIMSYGHSLTVGPRPINSKEGQRTTPYSIRNKSQLLTIWICWHGNKKIVRLNYFIKFCTFCNSFAYIKTRFVPVRIMWLIKKVSSFTNSSFFSAFRHYLSLIF
jgi:hypothetical protein